MEGKKYYLGLDIGTDSVGFAVTDEDYNLIRKQGKHLWGARLFDEAKDASGRRAQRASRRRLQRRRARIKMLREIMGEEINKIDPLFFKRLDESSLHKEDKSDGIYLPYGFTDDKSLFNKYPTIYHLRKAMLESEGKFDVRLVYLVLAHMIKYRGNFLRQGQIQQGGASPKEVEVLFDQINDSIKTLSGSPEDDDYEEPDLFKVSDEQAKKLIDSFKTDIKKSERIDREAEIFGEKPKGVKHAVLSFINGGEVQLVKFFPRLKEDDPDLAKAKIKTDIEDFDNKILEFNLMEEENEFLKTCKSLADVLLLVNLLKGENSITNAMVQVYDDYQKDMVNLRGYINGLVGLGILSKDDKENFWHGTSGVTYATYSGKKGNGKHEKPIEKCKQEDFEKAVENWLKLCPEGNKELADYKKAISSRMETGKFLQRQNNPNNGVFPYQLNENELTVILEKQGKHYPCLLSKDKGFPNPNKKEYKIVSLLRYRIPYFVGPISKYDDSMPNHWIVKKDKDTKIYPWNFYDVVDKAASAKAFMDNLRNTCTYIKGEETMPKNSLVFQEYKVLNELNNLYANNAPLTQAMKGYLFENLYLKKKTIKPKDIKDSLKAFTGNAKLKVTPRANEEEEKIDYILKSSLSSWVDCSKIFGEGFYKDKEKFEKAEKMIAIITAFEDKDTREEQLKELLTEEEIKQVSKLNLGYKDYSPISRRLLTEIKTERLNKDTGEILSYSILDLLKSTNSNFMEIYEGGGYDFKKKVDAINLEKYGTTNNDTIKELIDDAYVSPGLKRSLFQTLHIIDELKRILHIENKGFDKIFVECTRAKEKPKATKARKKKLEEYFKAATKEVQKEFEIAKLQSELASKTDDQLRSKHLFLYFMQLGHDVYTGEEIDLNRLSQDYDIDHIIPQAYVKDDSFINTVLTSRGKNGTKTDNYPLPEGFITKKGKEWIEILNNITVDKIKMMPDGKKERLLRSEANKLTDDEIMGFVNRQLVNTNQAVKATCDILKLLEKHTEIVYSKASLVSDFRGIFELPKVRDLNDLHHANDAYLNIVVGDVYNQKFNNRITRAWIADIKANGGSYKAGPQWIFKSNVRSRDGKRTLWVPCQYQRTVEGDIELPTENATINKVRKTLSWNDPMITYKPQILVGDGGLFSKTSYLKGRETKPDNFPLKKIPLGEDPKTWLAKYGSYKTVTTPFYSLVKSRNGKKGWKYSLEGVPAPILANFDQSKPKEEMIGYFKAQGLTEPTIIIDKLPINTILKIPSKEVDCKKEVSLRISGKSDNNVICINVSQPMMDAEHKRYFKCVCNILGTNAPAGKKKDPSIYEKTDPYRESIVEGRQTVSRKGNAELFDYICGNLYSNPIFKGLPATGGTLEKIKLSKPEFEGLTTIGQCKVLTLLIKLISAKSVQQIDLSALGNGIPKNVGGIKRNKVLQPGVRIVQTSITGFYTKTLFVVPED